MAQLEWSNGALSDFEPEVLPSEKWALYSSFPTSHKITESLDTGFAYAMGYKALISFIEEKHSLSAKKLDKVNLFALSAYLLSLSPFRRASIVKTMHDWIPTYSYLCRQGRHYSPICPRCLLETETPNHVRICSAPAAIHGRKLLLDQYLASLVSLGTPIYIFATFELKLSSTLDIPFINRYKVTTPLETRAYQRLILAIRHQNIVGWTNFLRGYISSYWESAYTSAHSYTMEKKCSNWATQLAQATIELHHNIWKERNKAIHGSTRQEAKDKLRDRVIAQVHFIYKHPPKLHKRFARVSSVPLHDRIKRSTLNLQRWLSRLDHQKSVSRFLTSRPSGQLSLRAAYQRGNVDLPPVTKFPP